MESLNKSEVLLIFTYAPAGLGHLRVTDALRDGLDEKINSVLLGAEDTSITYWHRLSSVSPIFKRILDWITTGKNGYWFYDLYIWMLGLSSGRLYKQMEYLLLQQWEAKKTVVVVSTHFGRKMVWIWNWFGCLILYKKYLLLTKLTCAKLFYVGRY